MHWSLPGLSVALDFLDVTILLVRQMVPAIGEQPTSVKLTADFFLDDMFCVSGRKLSHVDGVS